jgi:hypothetical protein
MLFTAIFVQLCIYWEMALAEQDNKLQLHFRPPLLSHAKAEAPPTGFADRGFPGATFSAVFSPETLLVSCGAVVASSSPLLFPSSKKRD